MAEGRRGLGRGLSALLEEAHSPAPAETRRERGVAEIPIEHLHPNPNQPRKSFDEAALQELSDSVAVHGVLQPILVRPMSGAPGEFQIVAGERRWRAAQRAGLRGVPVLVRDLAPEDVIGIALIENVQRADLNPLEEAQGYHEMTARFGHTADAIAKAVGKSRSHVANTLRLMRLPAGVREHVIAGRLSAGHARALLDHADADALADRIVAKGLSVRQAEALARDKHELRRPAVAPSTPKDADTRAMEADLAELIGMAVEIRDRSGRGEVLIKYRSLEQLDEICARLSTRPAKV